MESLSLNLGIEVTWFYCILFGFIGKGLLKEWEREDMHKKRKKEKGSKTRVMKWNGFSFTNVCPSLRARFLGSAFSSGVRWKVVTVVVAVFRCIGFLACQLGQSSKMARLILEIGLDTGMLSLPIDCLANLIHVIFNESCMLRFTSVIRLYCYPLSKFSINQS